MNSNLKLYYVLLTKDTNGYTATVPNLLKMSDIKVTTDNKAGTLAQTKHVISVRVAYLMFHNHESHLRDADDQHVDKNDVKSNQSIAPIVINIQRIIERQKPKMVRKNVSITAWENAIAKAYHYNCSHLLAHAIDEKYHENKVFSGKHAFKEWSEKYMQAIRLFLKESGD